MSNNDNVDSKIEFSMESPSVNTFGQLFSITNSILIILVIYFIYKYFRNKKKNKEENQPLILPDPLPKHDMTLDELQKYNGKGPDKRICIAILGNVYDCSKGYNYYGPNGAYSTFAGRDASRALAKFDVMAVKEEWDDITDLGEHEMSVVSEWNEQFREKYDYVGRLVRSKEEILERPDFEEDFSNEDNDNENNRKTKSLNLKTKKVINSEESSDEANVNINKKVSFNIPKDEVKTDKRSDNSSDEIEVIEN